MTRRPVQAGIKGIRAAFADALRTVEEQAWRPDPPPELPRDGVKPGEWEGRPWDRMPKDCPVRVIGYNGPMTYVLSASGQLMEVESWDHTKLATIFAPYTNFLYWAWPRRGKPREQVRPDGDVEMIYPINGLEIHKAATCLINEGRRRGLWDPARGHRGRGGWRTSREAGERFLWHSGEFLWSSGPGGKLQAARPGEIDGALYTLQPDTLRPWQEPVDVESTPASGLLEDFRTWNWERPQLDPLLVVGWLACALMGGALDQRPILFTTGGAGVGKSTLQAIMREVLAGVVFSAADTTAAGIYQQIGRDSRPVMIDELEAKPGSSRATAVIELARIAYSGDEMARGGQDHEGVTFTARSAFAFSAINPPPMAQQDKSRMAVLNLGRLDAKGARAGDVTVQAEDGRMLLRQVMDGWPQFWGELLPRWKQALAAAGLSARAGDTYGTLLAAAELLVGAEAMAALGLPMTDDAEIGRLVVEATAVERAEQLDNWQRCLEHLLASPIEAWKGGERQTVGGVLESLERAAKPAERVEIAPEKEKLAAAGLGLKVLTVEAEAGPSMRYMLAVPSKGPALERIYADTEWARGVWTGALKQAPATIVLRDRGNDQVVKINRVAERCLLVDLAAYDAAAGRE